VNVTLSPRATLIWAICFAIALGVILGLLTAEWGVFPA
jgi:hypothetical protein